MKLSTEKKDLQKVYEKQKGIDILNQCFFEATSGFFVWPKSHGFSTTPSSCGRSSGRSCGSCSVLLSGMSPGGPWGQVGKG
jgi:hypothetical protein